MNVKLDEFYEIPEYSRYLIAKDGRVLRKKDLSLVSGSTNPAGYHNYRLTGDNGRVFTWGRHRLMCYVFKPREGYENLTVNHKNGIKGDDFLDNLEWATYQANQQHAGANGLTSKCTPMATKNCHTGEVKKYPSIVACARELGYSKDTVNWRVKAGPNRIFPDGLQYKKGHNDDWPNVPLDKIKKVFGRSLSVKLRSLITGKEFSFSKLSDMAVFLGISLTSAFNWLQVEDQPVIPGYYQIKGGHDASPWRKVLDPIEELQRFSGKRFVVLIQQNNPPLMFETLEEAANHLSCVISTLHRKLNTGLKRHVFSEGIAQYYSSLTCSKLKRSVWLEIVKLNSP